MRFLALESQRQARRVPSGHSIRPFAAKGATSRQYMMDHHGVSVNKTTIFAKIHR
jgi:hypothetical protein